MHLIRPISPKSESNARITLKGETITVFFPPKREGFRQLMRDNDYTWHDPYWRRQVEEAAAPDRLIEIACKILTAGFIVAVADEEQQRRVIAQEYTPEQHRWIKAIVAGDYAGWFSLSWHRSQDYYAAAKRIEGARYVKPRLVVPPEMFAQVEDFAERYGFSVSDKARQIAESARTELMGAAVVAFAAAPAPERTEKITGKPATLEVPDLVEIDHELVDDLA